MVESTFATLRVAARPTFVGLSIEPVMSRLAPIALVIACTHPTTPTQRATTAHQPRLVVLLVIDQLPEWAFEAKRPALTGGFARLLTEGEWHVGRHPSAATLTAPGHALLGTGEPTAHSGILANKWWHREVARELESTRDADGNETRAWLRVPGLGDAIATRPGAKAVAISLKDRAAILPLGHRGEAIWYDKALPGWTSLAPIAWLADWNHAQPIAAHLHDAWTPLDRARLAELSGTVDDQPGEVGDKGLGPTFPHAADRTPDPADAIFAMPLGNDLVLDTATHAIEVEQLGADDTPDLLVISLSAYDYIGHGWGHESWEAWDATLRLDARLATFLADLDRLVPGRWSMIVTSDHGASPLPERARGGRITFEALQLAANNAATAVLGPGTWIDNAHYPNVFFSKAMLAQPKGELASAEKRVIFGLRAFPGIAQVGRVADYAGHCETRTGDAFALCLTFDPERSGDLFYLPAPGWILHGADEHAATSHGSLHDYDRLVPVILLDPERRPHAPPDQPGSTIEMVRIAPMLAHWLGVPPPSTLPR